MTNRTKCLVLVLALALGAPATGVAQQKKDDAKTKATPSKTTDAAKGSATDTTKKTKKAEAAKGDPAALAAVHRAKSVFVFAMESCDRPERCDPSLREDAERRFLDACRLCASAERCEAERDAIRAGRGKRRTNPCVAE